MRTVYSVGDKIVNPLIRIVIVLVLTLMLNTKGFAQNKNIIGLSFTNELTSKNDIRPGLGLTFERQITRHCGFETGLFYRTFKNRMYVTWNTETYYLEVVENYLSIPVLFKYYSRILNFSAGPSIDYYIGWSGHTSSTNATLTSVNVKPKTYFGFMFKASKKINISDKVIIEPEIRFNPILKYNRHYVGIGIALKYKL